MPGAARRRDRGMRRRTRRFIEHADKARRSGTWQMRRHRRRLVSGARGPQTSRVEEKERGTMQGGAGEARITASVSEGFL